MIKLVKGQEFKYPVRPFSYIEKKNPLLFVILPITRWLRAKCTERYMKPAERHLDVGCGDGFFLRRSKCVEKFGIDRLLGDEILDKLYFADSYFDYVTMLAVIEHLYYPQAIIKEIARVLKPSGMLIIVTPKAYSHPILKLYSHDVDEKHVMYFDLDKIKELSKGFFEIVDYWSFLFGFNQIFCLKKIT